VGYAGQVFDLTGKVVVVTGGSRGLGLSREEHFADEQGDDRVAELAVGLALRQAGHDADVSYGGPRLRSGRTSLSPRAVGLIAPCRG
jgi:NAD(P)-dependent dehydrogenase (short-subunit alcohol dehydrogenase family)